MRSRRFFLRSLLAVAFVASAAALSAAPKASGEPKSPNSLKVLVIGNSFSVCVIDEFPQIAKQMGVKLDLGSLSIGGTTLSDHWNLLEEATNATVVAYRFDRFTDGRKVVLGQRANPLKVIKSTKWDVVTIQQSSYSSMGKDSFHPEGDKLVAALRKLLPKAKIYVQETWSYPSWDDRYKDFGFDSKEMYEKVRDAYAEFARDHELGLIAVGTAAQRVPERDRLFTQPDYHFNKEGRYLQGLVWTATLFGIDLEKRHKSPAWLGEKRGRELREAAAGAALVSKQFKAK